MSIGNTIGNSTDAGKRLVVAERGNWSSVQAMTSGTTAALRIEGNGNGGCPRFALAGRWRLALTVTVRSRSLLRSNTPFLR